jgi:Trypsin
MSHRPASKGIFVFVVSFALVGFSSLAAGADFEPAEQNLKSDDGVAAIVDRELDEIDEMLVQVVASEHGISVEEATKRVVEQDAFETMVLGFEKDMTSWAGAWIDHDAGGVLVLGVTDPASGESLLATVPDLLTKRVRVETVDYSLRDLENLAETLTKSLTEGGVEVESMSIQPQSNGLLLIVHPSIGAQQTEVRQSILRNVPVRVNVEESNRLEAACSATLRVCDTPLRAGVEITNFQSNARTGGVSQCTLGFVVRLKNAGARKAMTAGHCYVGFGQPADTYGTGRPNFTNFGIGTVFPTSVPGYNATPVSLYNNDVMLINVGPVAGGTTGARVLVQTSGGNYPTTYNENYPITGIGYGSTVVGSYLCKTGQFSGTECAKVESFFSNIVTMRNPTGEYAAVTCVGDSGGPVFRVNKAYGMVVALYYGGQEIRDTYFAGTNQYRDCAGAGNLWEYYSMSAALATTGTELIP